MSDENSQVRLQDYSAEVKRRVPEWTEPVRKNPSPETLQVALTLLLGLEKKARLASDVDSTVELAKEVVGLCHEVGEWKTLREQISLLCKRRAQLPKVVQTVVQTAYALIDTTPDTETKADFIKTLREVSAGKIYVELERARMTRMLSEMEEEAGNFQEATKLIQEIQAETIGSMEVKEKAELLLEQIRLCLRTKDYIRAEIIMGKVSRKVLEDPELQALKLKYHNLCIGFYLHANRYLDGCRAFLQIANTPMVAADEKEWQPALQKATILCVLSPFDAELSDILARLTAEKRLERMPQYKSLVNLFVQKELMNWPLAEEKELKSNSLFLDAEHGEKRFADLRSRTVQHNLRVLGAYYSQITYARASQLLQLEPAGLEEALSELVSSQQLFAKIDRPAGIITFEKKKSSTQTLNSWASDINSLLALVNDTCHLINRENMVHGIRT